MYWFPKFNSRGSILYEDGNGSVLLNGEVKVRGGNRPCWLTDERWIYTVNNGGTFEFGVNKPLWEDEIHELAAGGGHWAGVWQGQLIVDGAKTGIIGGQPFYSLAGELTYKTSDHDYEPTILGSLRAWKDGASVVTNFGLGPFAGEGYPRLINGPWLITMTNTGLRIRGLDATGWELETGQDRNFAPAGHNTGSSIKVAHSGGMWIQPLSEPRKKLGGPVIIIPHIDAPPHTDAPHMSTPNRIDVVRDEFSKNPPAPDSTESCGEFTRRVARRLHAEDANWGMLTKGPGEGQYKGFAVDALIYKVTQQVVDILGGAEGPNPQPAWQEVPKRDSNHWAVPPDAVTPPPHTDAPPAPSPDLVAIHKAINALKAEMERLFAEEREQRQGLRNELLPRIERLEQRPEGVKPQRIKVKSASKWGHEHDVFIDIV